jgi:hypothetical protein
VLTVCVGGGEVPGHPFIVVPPQWARAPSTKHKPAVMPPPPTISVEVSRPEKKRLQKEYHKTLGAAKKGDPQAGSQHASRVPLIFIFNVHEPQATKAMRW